MSEETLARILYSPLTPMQRLVALDVVVTGRRDKASSFFALEDNASLKAIAARLRISERSVSDAMHSLVASGVLMWRRDVKPESAVNRYGEPIPINAASTRNGDFIEWAHTSVVALPVDVAIPDKALKPANVERARVRAASERQRVRQMQDELQALLRERDCPTCGAHGALQADVRATCATCGEIFDADKLDRMLSAPAIPNAPERSDADCAQVKATHLQSLQDSASVHDAGNADALKEECFSPSCDAHSSDAPANFAGVCDDEAPDVELAALPVELEGADAIAFLSSMGVDAFSRQHICGSKKAGYGASWLDDVMSASAAIEHLARSKRHLVGILPEHCDVVMLDVDAGLSEFFALHPDARAWCRVQRRNAPERAKFIVRMKGDKARNLVRETSDKARKVELIGARRAGVIAGKHPSGAQYTLVTGAIPELDVAQVRALIDAFVPALVAPAKFAGVCDAPGRSASGSAAKRAIAHWLAQPANVAATLALIERRPHAGKHFSLRDNDTTPSCMLTSADAVHDYGTGAHYDLFDVHCMLTGTDKRRAIDDAYKAMRASERSARETQFAGV